MAWPTSLQTGLKEWATVCHALEQGRQILLLRKGGISETAGEFEITHRQFLLFPTYVHQSPAMLKPESHTGFEPHSAEPARITLTGAGVVTDILKVTSRSAMDALDAEHIWAPPLIDMRFNYKPESPLYLLLVRAYRLHEPVTIDDTFAYSGCKSWVPLAQSVQTGGALPAMDDVKYEFHRRKALGAMAAA